MSSNAWSLRLLVAGLSIGLAPLAIAWGPYGPGPAGGYPQALIGMPPADLPSPVYPPPDKHPAPDTFRNWRKTLAPPPDGDAPPPSDPPGTPPTPGVNPQPPFGMGTYGPGFPPPAYRLPYGNPSPRAATRDTDGTAKPWLDRDTPPDASSPAAPRHPGYGPRFGGPTGFRLSRATSQDAYTLTIALDGTDPATIQVHTQGHWLILRRTHSAQRTRNHDRGDGRGFTRGFSHSSGTLSRRLSVPADGILSAMSREDDEDNIRIRIPRRSRPGAGRE